MSKVKLKIKESWDEVSIEDYIKLSKVSDGDLISIMEILTNADRKTLDSIDPNEIDIINQHLSWVNQSPNLEGDIPSEFKVGKDTFKYSREFNKLNLGEMVTFEMITERGKLTQLETIPLFLALVLRKVDSHGESEEYNADIISERAELFEEELSIGKTMSLFFCLSHSGKVPIEVLEDSLVELRQLRDKIIKK